jgi:hypothetical protein
MRLMMQIKTEEARVCHWRGEEDDEVGLMVRKQNILTVQKYFVSLCHNT